MVVRRSSSCMYPESATKCLARGHPVRVGCARPISHPRRWRIPMSKLKLTVESLQVETFETSDEAGARGTVLANDSLSNDTWCGEWGCDSTQLQLICTCTVQ